MDLPAQTIELLILVLAANAAPVVIALVLGQRFNMALDRGRNWIDQRPVLGQSKTLRGVLASFIITPAIAVALSMPASAGILIAAGAMLGDLLSSFSKRRLNIASHGSAPGIDQLPESILPLVFVQPLVKIDWPGWLWVIGLFCLIEWLLSHLLAHLLKKWE